MSAFSMIPLPRAGAAILGLALMAACGGGTPDVRVGPQAVHPSPSGLAKTSLYETAPAAGIAPRQEGDGLAQSLFNEFCLGKSAAESEQALVASGRFNAPSIIQLSAIGARYATYALKARDRAGVTIVTGSTGGLQCGVGVDNKGPNLFEDGRITQSG